MTLSNILNLLDKSAPKHLEDLCEWLKIPSVSSDSAHKSDVAAAASWVAQKLKKAGMSTEVLATEGHPLVLAETPPISGAPVALVYGHYDVQPAEPLADWISGAFEPTIRDGNLYARGATDDKGQLLTHVQSVCEWLSTGEPLPLQIKFLIEGEEEVGSQNLERLLPSLRERLACDCVVISDSSQYAKDQPAITYGLRGIATYEIEIKGPSQDLHSGSFGGAVMNPAIALCHLLSTLVDANGRIQVEGYYDDVQEVSATERAAWSSLPHSDAAFAQEIGVDALFGETGFTTNERRWARPTFDINGLTAGHQGEGVKTIIPASASAKISFRLVPNQDPKKVTQSLQAHIDEHLVAGVRAILKPDHGAPGMAANPQSRYAEAATRAIETAFGKPPVLIREGGSIPIVSKFQDVLKCDCLLLGWGLSDDKPHSPNEKFCVQDYHRGIKASAMLWAELGKLKIQRN